MKAVFYDRKNKREVINDQLMEINLRERYCVIDAEEYRSGKWDPSKHQGYIQERQIASLGYKSEKCPSYCNWDLYLNPEDLIFLRLE